MSRRIDLQRPLTEEEKQHLLTRANGRQLIQINERQFAGLSAKQKDEVRATAARDEEQLRKEEEARRKAEDAQDDEDSYHPEDIAQVAELTVAELRQRLSKAGLRNTVTAKDQEIEGTDDHLTEKEVLAYRVLDYLDEQRKNKG